MKTVVDSLFHRKILYYMIWKMSKSPVAKYGGFPPFFEVRVIGESSWLFFCCRKFFKQLDNGPAAIFFSENPELLFLLWSGVAVFVCLVVVHYRLCKEHVLVGDVGKNPVVEEFYELNGRRDRDG